MKKNYLVILITACVLAGCISTHMSNTPTATLENAMEVRPGVYVTNKASVLPLPTSGYDIYLIGEWHGQREVHLLFLEYLKILHKNVGLRDIILEVDQVAERQANEYTLGIISKMSEGLYSRPDRIDVLEDVRAFNETLPNNEKIRVHLADIDYPLLRIHIHLQNIQGRIGATAEDVQIPPLDEFKYWSKNKMLALVDQLREATDDDSIINELETVRPSVLYFIYGGTSISQIREETITNNIQYILKELDGAPVLALYGAWHARQTTDFPPEYRPWAQRLTELGINIYSVYSTGISGQYWYQSPWCPAGIYKLNMPPDKIYFGDGSTLSDIFDNASNYDIVYVDLQLDANTSLRYSESDTDWSEILDPNTPIAKMFNGLILFRKATPTRDSNS